ncbi:type 2 lantipeptide synthetase LanM [Erwinia sp. CPCC 100877]|nr:type 2 lantipeptide synthetase LanM [Erwinia sp. CPCC 100877]
MSEDLTYSYAATLQERRQGWQELGLNAEEHDYLQQWQDRKSLLKPNDYSKIFAYHQCTPTEFTKGLLPFTEERARLLLPIIEKSEWYQLHRSLFAEEVPLQEKDLTAALRFHLAYYEAKIREYLQQQIDLHLSEAEIKSLVAQLSEELFFIAQKALVWDVHQMVAEYQLQAETKEEEFNSYITEFLGDKQRTYLFFGAYPALARILAVRLQFACENIISFFEALIQSKKELTTTFALNEPFVAPVQIKLGQGDSHDQGKTVIQFRLEEKELIFKNKNLLIGERFNSFLSFLEAITDDFSAYKIKRVVCADFTIEEKVPQIECQNEQEIKAFYTHYGQLLAIVYWLGSTDLHMENLIASGVHPVLIDVETLIRPEIFNHKKLSRQTRIEKDSVIVSGLLPQKRHWQREVELDALSGKKQKLPQKVRRLTHQRTSDIQFQLEEAYMEGAQNIPRLNGQEIAYQPYVEQIEGAFKKMNDQLLQNKALVIEKVKELFADVTVRLIYRDTQDYGNLLSYTLHTDCMSDFIEREKILENLWSNQQIPQRLIPLEIEAMSVMDIPLFTANTSSKAVYANRQVIPQLLKKSPLENTIEHIERITETTSQFSYLLIKESLGTLNYQLTETKLPKKNQSLASPLLQKAADIGDEIIRNILVDQTSDTVDWLSIMPNEQGENSVTYPGSDLYDGVAGVYVFLVILQHYVPKEAYQKVITKLEKEIFLAPLENTYESAYFDEGMRLTTAFLVAELLQDAKHRSYLMTSLNQLKNVHITEAQQMNEWLYGKASLIAILAAVYERYHEKTAYDLLKHYVEAIDCSEMDDASFAHGYAGVVYGLWRANQLLEDQRVTQKIHWYQERLAEQLLREDRKNSSWCRGTTGISKACAAVNQPLKKVSSIHKLQDDCLCHGSYGKADNNLGNISLLVENDLKLKSEPNYSSLGLFCGLSGVGYQILRAYNAATIPSLLFFS